MGIKKNYAFLTIFQVVAYQVGTINPLPLLNYIAGRIALYDYEAELPILASSAMVLNFLLSFKSQYELKFQWIRIFRCFRVSRTAMKCLGYSFLGATAE